MGETISTVISRSRAHSGRDERAACSLSFECYRAGGFLVVYRLREWGDLVMRNELGVNYRNVLIIFAISVAVTACSNKKYNNWSECFSQEIKSNGDYKLSLIYCNSNYEKTSEESVELSAVGLNGVGETVNVRMPNGQIINNVPKNITQKELLQVLSSSGYNTDSLLEQKNPAITSNPDGSLDYNK